MPNKKLAKEIAHWTAVCRGCSRANGVKVAEIGGNQDMPFEQAFSNLAHTYLRDKAPSLMDYEVGFQLIDRNQENTKAVGVFGFKVGSQWLYAPVFFLNGDLKGHELLYIKSQDTFVPMKENWLNYILNRRPHVLGGGITRNMAEIGVVPPNLYQLSRSPHKFASVKKWPNWAQDALMVIAHAVMSSPTKQAKFAGLADFPTFLKKEGKAAVVPLLHTCKLFPKLASTIDQFYGLSIIKEAIDLIKEQEAASTSVLKSSVKTASAPGRLTGTVLPPAPEKNPIKNGTLKIAVKADLDRPNDEFDSLSDKDRNTLLRDGVMIKDKRLNVSKAYTVQTEMKLTNPTETGIYEVLTGPGEFEKCLVILGPHAAGCRKNFATVVRLDKDKNWINIHPSYVWTGSRMEGEAYQDWLEKQPEVDSMKAGKGNWYVILGPNGQGTLPFNPEEEINDENGICTYSANFIRYATKERPDHLKSNYPSLSAWDDYDHDDGQRLIITNKDGAMKTGRGTLYIPNGCKLITINDAVDDNDDDDEGGGKKEGPYELASLSHAYGSSCGLSDKPPLALGNMDDIQLLLMKKTAAMKIYHTGTEVVINSARMTPLQGLIHLVRDHGLGEKQARVMLKEAELNKVARYRIKYADEYYDLQKSGPVAPPMPSLPVGFDPMTSGMVPTQSLLEAAVPVPGMSATLTNRDIYRPQGPEPDYQAKPDLNAVQYAQQAAQSGQKEVFDTAMIGSLLKATRDDSMVDRWLPDIMKGLDRLGRVLMIFYWHQDEFAERYGKSELPELEDGLRNAFEAVGDILLALKQKTVDPYPDEINKVDLGPVSNM